MLTDKTWQSSFYLSQKSHQRPNFPLAMQLLGPSTMASNYVVESPTVTINSDSPQELRRDADGSPRKRRKLSELTPEPDTSDIPSSTAPQPPTAQFPDSEQSGEPTVDDSSSIIPSTSSADKTIAPFLTRHIRDHYAPMNRFEPQKIERNPNSKYCYRHRPDLKCRRQADELTMDQMQKVGGSYHLFI